jgi:benzoyl-CoA reductase subunit D
MIWCGIDVGSRSVKVVFVEETASGVAVRARHILFPGELDLAEGAALAYADGLKAAGLSAAQVTGIVATGAGRKLAACAGDDVTEVSAAARGTAFVCPAAHTVIDVGAEEGRAVRCDAAGHALDFAANEKCAAGAGAFAESMARALQLSLEEFGESAMRSTRLIPMNAQCTVFAESEVVSLIHSATPKEDIAKAVLDAVASRVCAMVRRVGIEGEVVLIGGMVHNAGFVQSLKAAMGVDAISLPDMPEYISALGCALIAAERQH